MPSLASGRMDRTIVIQTAAKSVDPVTNQEVLTWLSAPPIYAEWLPSNAREVWSARQINAEVEAIYQVYDQHPRPTPDGSRILGHDGRLYDVAGVTEIGRGAGLQIAVIAKASA